MYIASPRSELAIAPLHVCLPDADPLAPLVGRDGARARGQRGPDLPEADLAGRDGRPLRRRRLLRVGPAQRHEALALARRVEPVGDARVAMRNYVSQPAVGVALGLEAVHARLVVREVERLAPEVREMEPDVLR